MNLLAPFHLAFPVHCINEARSFYGELLGCEEGRSSEHWVDFSLFGHQIVAHYSPDAVRRSESVDAVDAHHVPVPHFGVVLDWSDWQQLADRLKSAGVTFVIEPCVRFAGEPGEQATMFLLDPSGNALEFKAMKNPANLFAK